MAYIKVTIFFPLGVQLILKRTTKKFFDQVVNICHEKVFCNLPVCLFHHIATDLLYFDKIAY